MLTTFMPTSCQPYEQFLFEVFTVPGYIDTDYVEPRGTPELWKYLYPDRLMLNLKIIMYNFQIVNRPN